MLLKVAFLSLALTSMAFAQQRPTGPAKTDNAEPPWFQYLEDDSAIIIDKVKANIATCELQSKVKKELKNFVNLAVLVQTLQSEHLVKVWEAHQDLGTEPCEKKSLIEFSPEVLCLLSGTEKEMNKILRDSRMPIYLQSFQLTADQSKELIAPIKMLNKKMLDDQKKKLKEEQRVLRLLKEKHKLKDD